MRRYNPRRMNASRRSIRRRRLNSGRYNLSFTGLAMDDYDTLLNQLKDISYNAQEAVRAVEAAFGTVSVQETFEEMAFQSSELLFAIKEFNQNANEACDECLGSYVQDQDMTEDDWID